MPITDAFLTTCRTAVARLPELTAFRTAITNLSNSSRTSRVAAYEAAFNDNGADKSPAYRLKKAIRDTVGAEADIAATLSPLDRESVYRSMVAQFVPNLPSPPSLATEQDQLRRLLLEDQFS